MPQTDRHGPRVDEQLKHETEALTRGAPDEPRTEARRQQSEGPGEPTLAVNRDESDALLDRRSYLAQVLAAASYPATATELLAVAELANAEEAAVAALRGLPPGDRYEAFGAVWAAVGGPDVDHPEPPQGRRIRTTGRAKTAPKAPRAKKAATAPAGPRRFGFASDALLAPFSLLFGVTSRTAWVEVDQDELEIRFGPWVLRTPRSNVAGCEITGPYRLAKVVGPPRLSLADRGITFATSRRPGVCIRFHEPVAAALPASLLRHPAATVTVDDPDALVQELSPPG